MDGKKQRLTPLLCPIYATIHSCIAVVVAVSFTMSNKYAGYELDAFGNRYQGSGTAACIQQPPRHNMYNSGPRVEDYDPSRRLDPVNVATYNSSTRGQPLSHQTVIPSTNAPNGGMASSNAATGIQMQGLVADFEPLPIGKAALQRLNPPPHGIDTSNRLHHPAVLGHNLGSSPLPGYFGSVPGASAQQNSDKWLDEIEMSVSGIALEPMKGSTVLLRVHTRTTEVSSRYLPCVDFLVQCQQELRKGLAVATRKRMVQHMFRDAMTPQQFYKTYVSNLPERFYRKNRRRMEAKNLDAAFKELQNLCASARAVQNQGCEVVKNTFLGGMKDGESWGLRKWLSKQGGALQICNDCECVLHACQKLDRSSDSTKKLGQRLRPLAEQALKVLKSDVPSSYQEQSSAHPYLPFFHRLESALRGMSSFDPEDDDVICIDDDDEVEAIKSRATSSTKCKKRKTDTNENSTANRAPSPRKASLHSDDDSAIEILDVKPAASKRAKKSEYGSTDDAEYMRELLRTFDDDGQNDIFDQTFFARLPDGEKKDGFDLAAGLDRLAGVFDTNQHWNIRPSNIHVTSFWDEAENFASALRLFSEILKSPESAFCLDNVNEDEHPSYSQVIKHPLCFRDVVSALFGESDDSENSIVGSTGVLSPQGLSSWNMWRGKDLLQAIDLVFLNSLAYGKCAQEKRSDNRSKTNKLRKNFWEGIKRIIDVQVGEMNQEERRRCTPTRRGESSGFVIYKDR